MHAHRREILGKRREASEPEIERDGDLRGRWRRSWTSAAAILDLDRNAIMPCPALGFRKAAASHELGASEVGGGGRRCGGGSSRTSVATAPLGSRRWRRLSPLGVLRINLGIDRGEPCRTCVRFVCFFRWLIFVGCFLLVNLRRFYLLCFLDGFSLVVRGRGAGGATV